jgi:hypothetical protein
MTSVLNVDTIADKAGTGPVTLTKQQAAKAWADTNATGTTVNDSFNLSSLTDTSTGQQTFNFSTSFNSTSYCSLLTVRNNVSQIWIEDANKAAGSAQGRSFTGSTYQDVPQDALFAGDLA